MRVRRYHFDVIDSTNEWAKSNVHLFDQKEMTLVTADEQTEGKGRFRRRWISPAQENIYATFCFFPLQGRQNLGNISQILALSCVDVLEKCSFEITLKWPNDLLIEGKKVAGILCETTFFEEQFCFFAGIGVNVNLSLEELEKIGQPVTSLRVLSGRKVDHGRILGELEKVFNKNLTAFLEQGFSPFLSKYRQRIVENNNKKLKIKDGKKTYDCFFESIDDKGALCVRLAGGELKTFTAGELIDV